MAKITKKQCPCAQRSVEYRPLNL